MGIHVENQSSGNRCSIVAGNVCRLTRLGDVDSLDARPPGSMLITELASINRKPENRGEIGTIRFLLIPWPILGRGNHRPKYLNPCKGS
jgi:hypothetical protein